MIGNSMGGWLALRFAAAYPQTTAALILMAPSGIVAPREDFLHQIVDVASNPDSAESTWDAVAGSADVPPEVLKFMTLVMENFIPFTGALQVLTDAQMRRLTMPVLYIAGTGDATTDTGHAARRLTSLVPHAKIVLREGRACNHQRVGGDPPVFI